MEINIGALIKARAKELRIGPTELGQRINTSKQNVYGIFKRKSVDSELLMQISIALNYDFFQTYVTMLPFRDGNGEKMKAGHGARSLDEARQEIDGLRKENEYLKKINQLLEEKLSR